MSLSVSERHKTSCAKDSFLEMRSTFSPQNCTIPVSHHYHRHYHFNRKAEKHYIIVTIWIARLVMITIVTIWLMEVSSQLDTPPPSPPCPPPRPPPRNKTPSNCRHCHHHLRHLSFSSTTGCFYWFQEVISVCCGSNKRGSPWSSKKTNKDTKKCFVAIRKKHSLYHSHTTIEHTELPLSCQLHQFQLAYGGSLLVQFDST